MLFATVCGCNRMNSKKYVGTALDPLVDPAHVDTTKFNSEYLLYSTVKINGLLPLQSKFAEFRKVIGKPDSLVNFNDTMDCQSYEEPYQYIYFQGNVFDLVNDTAIFQHLDFRTRPDLRLECPAITLDSKTSLQEVEKLFPRAVHRMTTVNVQGSGPLRSIDLGASKQYADEWWILFFDGDKLVRVDMYAPC